ncbi:right-handed parallel beta-helix repeat-containing protein [Sporosarcina gallistercoris]|uniref:AAA family ATPase n=1 Tax=Sporosarcina gallistercoris TaxID=2762245 RepID=A0ABR8PLM8_9BACL|nr:right-handed parallel beta-helix repeat-containing protein [Sporosarcina gallistercoris]MBD7909086.1 AAA family ATPase [Sporosarcina gallistercoris]
MTILNVSVRPDSSYPTITSAIQSALHGDTVEIEDGIYHEYLQIDKPLILRSASEDARSVCITGGIHIDAADEVRIESITVGNGTAPVDYGLHIESGQVTLHHCLFSKIQGKAMRVDEKANVSAEHTGFKKNIQGIEVSGCLALFDCIIEETTENAQLAVQDGGELALTDCGILSGQEEGISLTGGSRCTVTKSSIIGNSGAQISMEEDSFLALEQTNFYLGKATGISSDHSKGIIKNCNFNMQHLAHVDLKNDSHFQVESSTFENGESEGVSISNSSAEITDSLFKGQKSDQLICIEQSNVSMKRTRLVSGKDRGIVCVNSTCTIIESVVKYHQMTQLSAFSESVLTILDCDIEKGKNKGIYAADSQVKISDSRVSHHKSAQVFASEHSELTVSATEVKSGKSVGLSAKESTLNVYNCIISDQKGSNISLGSDVQAQIADCRISNGEKNGVLIGPGTVVSMERTVLFHHKRPQVSASKSAEVSLTECELYEGNSSGVSFSQVERIEVTDTRVHGHRDDQIVLKECPSAIFKSMQVMNGKKAGLRVEKSAPLLEDCHFDNNRAGDLDRLDDSNPLLKNTELSVPAVSAGQDGRVNVGTLAKQTKAKDSPVNEEMMNVLMNALDEYIGLEVIKDKIRDMKNLVEINQFKAEKGLPTIEVVAPHMVFQGNPGTGKTTVARLMGGVFKWLGLLEKGHLVEVKREDLVGTHVGSSEELTKMKIQEAMGGVLFIDEAYSLIAGKNSSNDYGQKVIDTLLPAMENHRGEFVVIAAGYTEDMDRFLTSNPGLKDRFTEKLFFEDYTPDELLRIVLSNCEGSYSVTEAAQRAIQNEFIERYRKRDQTFSNARMARTLYDQIGLAQSLRIAKFSRDQWTEELLTTFEEEDVLQAVGKRDVKSYKVPIDEELLSKKRAELHQFIGLEKVKAEIDEMIELMRYYKRENHSAEKLMNHTLLIGKPGTGKTEVARVLAGIYQALGLLERGELIEVDRSDLVGTHIGETEKRTADQIERAMGSALFIDEAYTLAGSGENDYGKKAVEVLLKQMSDRQGEFLLIAAGYEKEMTRFLDSNAGLRRRFGLTLHFDDYTPEELMEITELYIQGYVLTIEAKNMLYGHYQDIYQNRDDHFGNAGLAKKMAKEMTRKVDYRMAIASSSQLSDGLKKEITIGDLVLLES